MIDADSNTTSYLAPARRLVDGFDYDWPALIQQASDPTFLHWIMSANPPLERLNTTECIKRYRADPEDDMSMSDFVLVVNDDDWHVGWTSQFIIKMPRDYSPSSNITTFATQSPLDTTSEVRWMCPDVMSDSCETEDLLKEETWTVRGSMNLTVSYCLARQLEPSCELNVSLQLLLAVVICNAVKLVAMCMAAFVLRKGRVLLTIGDAIASFLEREDPSTKSLGVVRGYKLVKYWRKNESPPAKPDKKTMVGNIVDTEGGAYGFALIL